MRTGLITPLILRSKLSPLEVGGNGSNPFMKKVVDELGVTSIVSLPSPASIVSDGAPITASWFTARTANVTVCRATCACADVAASSASASVASRSERRLRDTVYMEGRRRRFAEEADCISLTHRMHSVQTVVIPKANGECATSPLQ